MQQESNTDEKRASAPNLRVLERRRSHQSAADDADSILQYWRILKRRRFLFAIPAIAIALLTTVYALSLTDIYRSEATILIEDQEIPEDIIGATISNYASQQIQLVSQRLFTVQNITEVVEKFRVYPMTDDKGDAIPGANLARWFRNDLELDLVSAEVLDSRGQSVEAAVAFTLAFNSPNPEIAQQVTEEVVALFQSENERSTASRTIGVSALLTSAIKEANEELLETEARLAEFKANNEGALPELYQLNLTVINRAEEQLSDTNLRIQELRQRKLQLSSELASLSPSAPVTLPSGETVMSDRERLRALLVDYRRKSSVYESGHPDLVRLEREIESLRGSVGGAESYSLIQDQLRQERDRLAGLRDRYSDNHPDIKYAEAAIAKLEAQLAATDRNATSATEVADNPAYILINTQLQSTDLEIQSLLEKRRELQATIDEHEALIRQAPRVEMQYEALRRNADNARTKYSDLQAKLRAADVATDVEQEITGRRFTLIEPPVFPIQPEDQHKAAILLLGFLFAAGVGAALVVLAEILDDSIRSARQLTQVTGAPPLVVIPYLDNSADLAQAKTRRFYLVAAFLAGTALSVVLVAYLF